MITMQPGYAPPPVVTAQPAMMNTTTTTVITTGPAAGLRPWNSGLFDCFNDCKSCECKGLLKIYLSKTFFFMRTGLKHVLIINFTVFFVISFK